MNTTPFTMHHFTAAKFGQNVTTTTNAAQMGQVVGVLSSGESGVHYLRPVEGGAGFQALTPANTAATHHQQLITLPITVPGAKPGDPQQTIQIQVMNPNVTTLASQVGVHQPKYQMTHIPLQTFTQGDLGTVLTVAYAQQTDGNEGVQIVGNAGLPEGLQVVAAIQPQDLQMVTAPANKSQGSEAPQTIQLSALIPGHHLINVEDIKKNANNNNTTFRIKQESYGTDESGTETAQTVAQGTQQWTLPIENHDISEYICQIPNGSQLHQFLRFNNDTSAKAEDTAESENTEGNSKESRDNEEFTQQAAEVGETVEAPTKTKKKKKYKKKPPKPKKPKPGQVVIATALDGTTLFCCPECHLAYPKKEQLEQHLTGHKIERRYICGICGAGLKRREHLERHKLGHNPARPFVCSVCLKGFKRKEHLNLHFVIHSGEKTEICTECGKGFYRKDHLRKHTRAHATRRARELIVQQYRHHISQTESGETATTNTTTTSTATTTSLLPNIQPEITIHVPTSTASVPVHITLPPHIVAMSNTNTGSIDNSSVQIKEEMIIP